MNGNMTPKSLDQNMDEEDERHAGEGIIPPSEAAAAQATSSGATGVLYNNTKGTEDGSHIGA